MAFDPFGDFEERGYLRNKAGQKDLAKVKMLEHVAFHSHVNEAISKLRASKPLSYQDVLDTHRRLFGTVYPWAGEDRTVNAPNLRISKAGQSGLFADPPEVRRATEYALSQGTNAKIMREKPGEVWGLLAYAHPFLDGNGRTIMVVHGELCRRAALHIEWRNIQKGEWLAALTRELVEPNRGHLDRFLKPHVRLQAVTATQESALLRSLSGLGPKVESEPPKPKAARASAGEVVRSEAAEPRPTPASTPLAVQSVVAPASCPNPAEAPTQPPAPAMTSPVAAEPLVPARPHTALTPENLHAAVLADDEVGRLRKFAMAAAGDVFTTREGALAEVDRRLVADPSSAAQIAKAVRDRPREFGQLPGKTGLLGDSPERAKAKQGIEQLAEDVLAYGKVYHETRHRIATADETQAHRSGLEVPAPSTALRAVLTGERSLESLSEAERDALRPEAWRLRTAIERRFSPEERSALAGGDTTPLRLAGVTENLAGLAAVLTRASTITNQMAPKEGAEQAQMRGTALEQ